MTEPPVFQPFAQRRVVEPTAPEPVVPAAATTSPAAVPEPNDDDPATGLPRSWAPELDTLLPADTVVASPPRGRRRSAVVEAPPVPVVEPIPAEPPAELVALIEEVAQVEGSAAAAVEPAVRVEPPVDVQPDDVQPDDAQPDDACSRSTCSRPRRSRPRRLPRRTGPNDATVPRGSA